MADNAVFVEFGAKIDGLVSGVNEVKQQLSSLNSHAESLGAGFDKLKDVIAGAFSVDAIISFVEKMGELGLQTERTMATLGMSAEQVGMLSGVAQLTGTSMDSLAIQINRLSLNVQRSTADAVNPQAEALRVLGLRAKDLIGIPTSEYIEKLHDAVSKFNPSLNLTNALTAIGGRGFAQMLPFLQQSDEHWREMKAAITEANGALAAAIPGMANTHEQIKLLSLTTQGLSAELFSALKPAIDGVVGSMTDFMRNTRDMTKTGGALEGIFNTIQIVVKGAAAAFALASSGVLEFGIAVETIFKLAAGRIEDFEQHAKTQAAAMEKVAGDLKKRLDEIWSNPTQITVNKPGGMDARSMNEGLAKGLADRLKIIDNEYALEKERINAQYGTFIFTEGAKTAALLAALDKRYQEEVAAGEKTTVAYSKYALDRQKILDAANKSYEKSLNEAFSGLQGAINGQLRGMLAGTTSFAQGFKAIIGDMVIWVIQEFEKMAFKWLAHELVMTAATETGVAARTTSEAAGATAAEGAQIGKAIASIFRSAGETFAGVFAFLAPVMGPAAAGPAAASEATVLGVGASIAGAAVGTDYIARTGLVTVHQGEAIVPAQFNPGFTGVNPQAPAIGSLTISAVDSRSFASMLQSNPAPFVALLKRVIRDGLVNLEPAR